ncbi:DUF4411 family protein [Conservatibacter flavescens]|uniref:DUF4411 domain-containing protein n=1 Tax=Conservatibacter flavescens TaxID=28161 RepID=A0A2M8S2T5_9PAST|nr:DUF4411 family protein [Conservatibacter flavescens]PJG85446.1 DUF4411 domain-containing protein [Conservatibacter flavescens]
MKRYLIDANIFITAKNTFYQFGFAQCFWDLLLELHKKGIVYSIKAVKDELLAQSDELKEWVKNVPDSFFEDHFESVDSYAKLMIYGQDLVNTKKVMQKAFDDFAEEKNADAWIIAHAMEHGYTLVTQEKFNPDAKKRIMIPNVAIAHHVETITLFEFMEKCAGHNFSIK